MTSSSSGIRSSADSRVDAVRQNVSSARLIRELRRAREVDGAHAPLAGAVGRRLLGQATLLRRVDERRDRVGGEDLAACA
jgi:hypothetical protein